MRPRLSTVLDSITCNNSQLRRGEGVWGVRGYQPRLWHKHTCVSNYECLGRKQERNYQHLVATNFFRHRNIFFERHKRLFLCLVCHLAVYPKSCSVMAGFAKYNHCHGVFPPGGTRPSLRWPLGVTQWHLKGPVSSLALFSIFILVKAQHAAHKYINKSSYLQYKNSFWFSYPLNCSRIYYSNEAPSKLPFWAILFLRRPTWQCPESKTCCQASFFKYGAPFI